MADVGGGGELGEEAVGGIGLALGEEAAERGAGGVEVQATFGAGFGEDFRDFGVFLFAAEVEDVFAVLGGEAGEMALRFLCHHACECRVGGRPFIDRPGKGKESFYFCRCGFFEALASWGIAARVFRSENVADIDMFGVRRAVGGEWVFFAAGRACGTESG